VIGPFPLGGLLRAARRVEYLPSLVHPISGKVLTRRMALAARKSGVEFSDDVVVRFEQSKNGFLLSGQRLSVHARAVILATGTVPVEPCSGLSHIHSDCRTLPNKISGASVVVTGGGDIAFDTALTARDRGAFVTIYVRTAVLKANAPLISEAKSRGIKVCLGSAVTISETSSTDSFSLFVTTGPKTKRLRADYLIRCHGRLPNDELWKMISRNHPISCGVRTPIAGLYAAGDLIRNNRYVATALSDGLQAASMADNFIKRGR